MPQEACIQIKEELVACVIRSDWYVALSPTLNTITRITIVHESVFS
jgi:hypothetical protein